MKYFLLILFSSGSLCYSQPNEIIQKINCDENLPETFLLSSSFYNQEDSILQYFLYLKGLEYLIKKGIEIEYVDSLPCRNGLISFGDDKLNMEIDSICTQKRLHFVYSNLVENYRVFYEHNKDFIGSIKNDCRKYYFLESEDEIFKILESLVS